MEELSEGVSYGADPYRDGVTLMPQAGASVARPAVGDHAVGEPERVSEAPRPLPGRADQASVRQREAVAPAFVPVPYEGVPPQGPGGAERKRAAVPVGDRAASARAATATRARRAGKTWNFGHAPIPARAAVRAGHAAPPSTGRCGRSRRTRSEPPDSEDGWRKRRPDPGEEGQDFY